jgi:hypothetical protein
MNVVGGDVGETLHRRIGCVEDDRDIRARLSLCRSAVRSSGDQIWSDQSACHKSRHVHVQDKHPQLRNLFCNDVQRWCTAGIQHNETGCTMRQAVKHAACVACRATQVGWEVKGGKETETDQSRSPLAFDLQSGFQLNSLSVHPDRHCRPICTVLGDVTLTLVVGGCKSST